MTDVNEKQPARTVPPNVELNFLKLLTTYLLYERSEETELRIAFEGLVTERHAHFHENHTAAVPAAEEPYLAAQAPRTVPWTECSNEVCRAARGILENARRQAVVMTPLSIQLMRAYGVFYTPHPDGSVHAKLAKRDSVDIITPPRPEGKIIIGS